MAMYKALFVASLLLSVVYMSAAQVTTASGTYWNVPGIYDYKIPSNVARIGISCIGASGGNNYYLANGGGNSAGNGASAYGEFYVTPNTWIKVIVGGKGGDAQSGSFSAGAGGGGGGSFVYQTTSYPLVAAGGGGGSAALSLGGTNYIGKDGSTNPNGIATQSGGLDDPPAPGYSAVSASGGKGWVEIRYNPIGKDSSTYFGAVGGYGGGGANYGQAAGGGGGYSGGAAGPTDGSSSGKVGGGGGGSYVHNSGFRATIQSQSTPGHGVVTISTKLACQNGATFNNVNSSCICLSGYKGISCELAPGCQGIPPIDNQTNAYPLLVDDNRYSNFTGNALNVVLQGPYVISRKYTSLTFSGGASVIPQCQLHGGNSWWSQSFADGWACSDQLILSLPWKNHTQCGFQQVSSDSNTAKYAARMQLAYEENTGDHFGVIVTRTVTHAYDVSVTFPKNIQASVSPINIESVVLFSCVLSGESYDYVNQQMKLSFKAVSPWSSMLGSQQPMEVFIPGNMDLVTGPVLENSGCKLDPGSSCVQNFFIIVKLKNESECTYNGKFYINARIYSCRESGGSVCNSAPVNMTFTMKSGSLCAEVSVTPTVSATLQISHTLDFSDPNNIQNFNYKLGQQAYFFVNIDAGPGNAVSLIFNQIKYTDVDGIDYQLFSLVDQFSPAGISSKMNLQPGAKYFSLYFSGAVFKIPFGEVYNYTISCTATVTYDGNKKREIEAVWGADGSQISPAASFSLSGAHHTNVNTAISAQDDREIVQPVAGSGLSLNGAIGLAAAGVVTGLVAVLAVVVVVFRKFTARLQAEKAASTPLLTQDL